MRFWLIFLADFLKTLYSLFFGPITEIEAEKRLVALIINLTCPAFLEIVKGTINLAS